MANKPTPSSGDNDRRIADAELLFGEDVAKRPQPQAPLIPEVAPGDDYALDERVEPIQRKVASVFDEAPIARPVVPPATPTSSRAREGPEPDRRVRTQIDDPDAVEQVWSRGAEWGQSLAILAAVVVATASIFFWSISAGFYTLAIVGVLSGAAVFLLLSYPILISLERPVRITPEQAVQDFYGALSHHVPHFRRMWLLLSTAGRTSGHFSNFPEFKKYWAGRLVKLRAGRSGRFAPLKFEVGDFNSDKSQGKSSVDAKYTIKVFVRGRQGETPIDTFRVETSLVKGQDRMWYLEKGFLPGERL